jgi:hypothetical protein
MLLEEYKRRRLAGEIPLAIAKSQGVSGNAAYKWERKLEASLEPDEYEVIQTPGSKRLRRHWVHNGPLKFKTKDALAREVRELTNKLRESEFKKASDIADMFSGNRGHVAESLVLYALQRRGLEVYRPTIPVSGTDFLVFNGKSYYRIEVKGTSAENLVVHTTHTFARKSVERQCHRIYEPGSVDFFILVNLIHEHIFVIPFSKILAGSAYTLSSSSDIWEFKDRFDLLA